MKQSSNKVANFAIALIMGAIIVSFALTGFEGFNNNVGQVAQVGDESISLGDYNRALQMNIDQFSRFSGGKALTQKQIRDYGLKQTTLNQLIGQKHMLNFASDLNFDAGKLYIKNEIKEYTMFQTGGQFDVGKYKQLLKANRLSPQKFEGQIVDQIKSKKLSKLIFSVQNSKTATKEMARLKGMKMKAVVASFAKEDMTKNLSVEAKKITEFVKDEKNKGTLDSLYKTYEAEFKAKNAKSKKKPKSLKQMQNELAKKHLQKIDRKQLTAFNEKLAADIKAHLEKNELGKLERLSKKYGFTVDKKYELGLLNLNYKGEKFDEAVVHPLFKTKDTKSVVTTFSSAINTTYLKPVSYDEKEVKAEDIEKDLRLSGQINSRTLNGEIVKHQEATTKVYTSPNLL